MDMNTFPVLRSAVENYSHPLKLRQFPQNALVVQFANGNAGGASSSWVDSIPINRLHPKGVEAFFTGRDGGSEPVAGQCVANESGNMVFVHWLGGVRSVAAPGHNPVAFDTLLDRSPAFLRAARDCIRNANNVQVVAYTGCPGVMASWRDDEVHGMFEQIVFSYYDLGFDGLCLDGVTESVCRTSRGRQIIGSIAEICAVRNKLLFVESRPDRKLWDHLEGRLHGTVTLLSQVIREDAGAPGYEDLVPFSELEASGCVNYVWNDLPPRGIKLIDGVGPTSRVGYFKGAEHPREIAEAVSSGVIALPFGLTRLMHSDTQMAPEDVTRLFGSGRPAAEILAANNFNA